ncbi:DUF4391 domain-containing protein [Clostridium botulinum]|uniref:DUF4391 domain-containing protein n=1 Tax=Clostridium botulinum TaxID=1491 RepID=UPI00069ACDCC|nr:DUF4391 domain-containing protein [Clostridium botulinum]KOA78099.1 hypothetical protein ADU78_02175 [Clostridium botulinum]MCD3276182.1 DUF4391 domain-containing protein [Clostridium botulinum C/D]MCD3287920.1 DUF4391 domain-containing protein [Clostridium botulinum C/D]MCD3290024.1 DUF4391 domain-containing protein [Clostridium botulinum C/D]MCD3304020.1 DUF4391 domain-containing protein [Clostridium botulinum C/D]
MLQKYFNLPKSCFINTRIPKKAFINNPEFNLKSKEKEILQKQVDNIYLKYSLKFDVLNIPNYEDQEVRYEEIQIIQVKINEQINEEKICDIIQKYIPYPMIIVIQCNDFIKFNISIKKINKVETEKLVVEKMIYTDWINLNELNKKERDFLESLHISKILAINLFRTYEGFINIINSFITSKYKASFEIQSVESNLKDIQLLEKIEILRDEIITLRNKLKQESNIGNRVNLNIQIKNIEKNILKIKSNLN